MKEMVHIIMTAEENMNIIQKITLPFTIIGAFNWGLIALFDFNLVTWITRGENIGAKIIYVLVAVCALVNILILFLDLKQTKHERV